MKRKFHAHTMWHQQYYTSTRRERLDRLVEATQAALADTRQAARRAVGECLVCFYIDDERLAGQAITAWYCGLCGAEALYANTGTPTLCRACATAHQLCVTCGGDVDLRTKRRTWATPTTPPPPPSDDA